ncbi:MAG: hypothetical protein IKN52_14595 [Victivallales bacterium]|nr:hypothetical protein [Victivallales bacterium]
MDGENENTQTQQVEQELQKTVENQQKTGDEVIVENVKKTLDKINGESPADQQPPENQEQQKPQDDNNKNNKQEQGKPADDNSGKDNQPPADQQPPENQEGKDKGEKKDDKPKPDFIKDMDKAFEKYAKDKTLGDEEWDVFMDGVKALRDAFVQLTQRVDQHEGFLKHQYDKEFRAKVDAAFDGLGEEYVEKLGRGSASKLDKAFLDNRAEILEKANILLAGYQANGKSVPMEDAIAEAAKMWAIDNLKPTQPKTERRQQFTQPPASDNSPLAKSEAAAVEVATKKLKEMIEKE